MDSISTTSVDLASFLVWHGLIFSECVYATPRSEFILHDTAGGRADTLRRLFIADLKTPIKLREFLDIRRGLINAVSIAREHPLRICRADDLEGHREAAWEQATARRRAAEQQQTQVTTG